MDIVKQDPSLPPMPKPEDFGITSSDWDNYGYEGFPGATNKIDAYKEAVKAWERVLGQRISHE
jgi:hypothetical protein